MTAENNTPPAPERVSYAELVGLKAAGRKFAMLTAYDHPTAAAAQAAGVHALLIGDSMGTVLLGRENTRETPLELLLMLGEAVRRGAPRVYLVGDLPYEAIAPGDESICRASRRFRGEAGCDAVKLEAEPGHARVVARLAAEGIETIVHLGLRPQQVLTPDGYRAQARDDAAIAELVRTARELVSAGAAMVLLEAVPNEASVAVAAAVGVPIIGCGAGPACDGHVVVTQDLLGLTPGRPPRFVPVLEHLGERVAAALRRYVTEVEAGRYPGPEHVYAVRRDAGVVS